MLHTEFVWNVTYRVWVQISPNNWATPTPSLSFWQFFVIKLEKIKKPVEQIVSQIRPLTPHWLVSTASPCNLCNSPTRTLSPTCWRVIVHQVGLRVSLLFRCSQLFSSVNKLHSWCNPEFLLCNVGLQSSGKYYRQTAKSPEIHGGGLPNLFLLNQIMKGLRCFSEGNRPKKAKAPLVLLWKAVVPTIQNFSLLWRHPRNERWQQCCATGVWSMKQSHSHSIAHTATLVVLIWKVLHCSLVTSRSSYETATRQFEMSKRFWGCHTVLLHVPAQLLHCFGSD